MVVEQPSALPRWIPGAELPAVTSDTLIEAVSRTREIAHVVRQSDGRIGIAFGGTVDTAGDPDPRHGNYSHLSSLPPLYPEWLGNRAFTEAHGIRFPYVAGAMANGIASPQMVIALARQGMLGILGTAGLSLKKMREYIEVTRQELAETAKPWGANLIHSPQQSDLEMATVELFFELGVPLASASAFMNLTPAVVRYATTGLYRQADGTVGRKNRLIAKISRPEVAAHFMRPAPDRILTNLVEAGYLTDQEALLAKEIPVAEDLTVESDSGGHTDNRPLSALFPVIAQLRDRVMTEQGYTTAIRLGAAGGLGTPRAVAAAFQLGADYVVTGSINQSSVEAAQSPAVKEMLADAEFTDVVMAPAGDMFEMGVEVQVLQRGTLFASRARRLFEIYSRYDSIESIPQQVREKLERDVFRNDMETIWQKTRSYFEDENPGEVERAENDPKHRLALVCRWYLGLSSKWPLDGAEDRRLDYQIWTGPAQGAFNFWVDGTFLESAAERHVVQMGLNLMDGAAIITRAQQFRTYGVAIPASAFAVQPRRLAIR